MADEKLFENLKDEILKRFTEEVEQLTERVALILERETMDVLTTDNKVASGDLRKSIRSKITKLTASYIIKCFAGVNYAQFVYDDTRPHFPPVNKIAKWVRLKGLAGSFSIKTRKRVGGIRKQFEEDTKLAWAIAWKIYRKGTKGLRFFNIALNQAWPYIEKEIQNLKFA
jgi:hypothetical protein